MKKKKLILGAFLATTSLMLLAGCGSKKTNHKSSEEIIVTGSQSGEAGSTQEESNNPTSGMIDQSSINSKEDGSSNVDENVYYEDALFNNSLLRINVNDNQISYIEQFGSTYSLYTPVYNSNNKISFFRVFTTRSKNINKSLLSLNYYQIQLDDLLGELIFHYDDNGNFVIIENSHSANDPYAIDNKGIINKVTFSKDGKFTKDLTTNSNAWTCNATDKLIEFQGVVFNAYNIKYQYTINGLYDIEMTTYNNGKSSSFFKISKTGNDINLNNGPSGYVDLTFKFENNKMTQVVNNKVAVSNTMDYTYNEDGTIYAVHTTGTTNVLSVEYDSNGKRTKETYNSSSTQYLYDKKGFCIGTKVLDSPYGNEYKITEYNDNFQPLVRMENGGHGKQSHEYTYDKNGRETSYKNYYYTSPDSEQRFLAYENIYTFDDSNRIIEDITYNYKNDGSVNGGNKVEFIYEDNKTTSKYYKCAGVKGIFNLQHIDVYEETENGRISENTTYSDGVKVSYNKTTVTTDDNGYSKEITKQIEYNTDGSEKKVTDITRGTSEEDNTIEYVITKVDGVLTQEEFTKYEGDLYIYGVTYKYDEYGVIKYEEKNSYEYDENGNVIASREESKSYNNLGLITHYTDVKYDDNDDTYYNKDEEYTYDTNNKVKTITEVVSKYNYGVYVTYKYETDYITNHGINLFNEEFDYYEKYRINNDETKTPIEGVQVFYNNKGLVTARHYYNSVSGTISDERSVSEYYTYDDNDKLVTIERIGNDFRFKTTLEYDANGKLVSEEKIDVNENQVIQDVLYDSNEKTEIEYFYEEDSNGFETEYRNIFYYKSLFDEYVVYKSATEIDSVISTYIGVNPEATMIGKQLVRTEYIANIYTLKDYKNAQIVTTNRNTYVDGDVTNLGFNSVKTTYYYQDGKAYKYTIVRTDLDNKVTKDVVCLVSYDDVETDESTEKNYVNEVLVSTILETRIYTINGRDETSASRTVIDHTNNDETKYYEWNYYLGDWEEVQK